MSNLFVHVTKLTSQMSVPDYFVLVLTIKQAQKIEQELRSPPHWKISTSVDGGMNRGSHVHRPGSNDPHWC